MDEVQELLVEAGLYLTKFFKSQNILWARYHILLWNNLCYDEWTTELKRTWEVQNNVNYRTFREMCKCYIHTHLNDDWSFLYSLVIRYLRWAPAIKPRKTRTGVLEYKEDISDALYRIVAQWCTSESSEQDSLEILYIAMDLSNFFLTIDEARPLLKKYDISL